MRLRNGMLNRGEPAIRELGKILENDTTIKYYRLLFKRWLMFGLCNLHFVVKVLLKYGNIAPSRVAASGRGEYFPIENADTPEARAKNRRTEIILTPKLDELFQIINQN